MTVVLSPSHVRVGYPVSPKGNVEVYEAVLVGPNAFRGTGFVAGTVKVKGVSIDTPVVCTVVLTRERDGLRVATTLSNGSTGAYRFNFINELDRYSVIAYNREHNYRAVIADNVTPEPM